MADEARDAANLPLSFRIPIISVFGLFLFATNLSVLQYTGIPIERLLAPEQAVSERHGGNQRMKACYTYACIYAGLLAAGLLATQLFQAQIVSIIVLAVMALLLFAPSRFRFIPFVHERRRFVSQICRIGFGGISTEEEGSRFLDILVADILTSYARVFGDACGFLCSLIGLHHGNILVNASIALSVSAPYWIRLRQCLILLARTNERSHLLNAIKYATAFPVIFLSALSATGIGRHEGDIIGGVSGSYISHGGLRRAWIVACLVNSVYSLYWDICRDWDLFIHQSTDHGVLGRPVHFNKSLYGFAIIADTILRFLWVAKFASQSTVMHWDYRFQYAEVLRRWMWLFLRVECEHVRSSGGVRLPLTEVELDERGGVAFTRGRRESDQHAQRSLLAGKIDQD